MIDLNLIERGADYNDLRKNYIIFICPFDVEAWRLEYMTLLMRDQEMIRRGREEGLQVGREEGLQAGRLQEFFIRTGRRLFDRKSSTESWYGYPKC